jgi:hypothetical protein
MVATQETTGTWLSVRGTTSDVTTCGICGREDLRRTVKLMEVETGTGFELGTVYAGTDCAARVAGCREHEMKQRARNVDAFARRDR